MKKWIPVSGDFNCPGRMKLTADEMGITIGTGRRALATTEWPSENVRLCEAVEEPDESQVLPAELLDAIARLIKNSQPRETVVLAEEINRFYDAKDTVREWLEKIQREQ